jgi:ribosome maturation factor RimP
LTQVKDIWGLVERYLAAERLELDDLELSGRGRGRVLRVTVDGAAVDVDRLAELSRGLSRLLDDQPDLQETYRLEVSSPGLERKLRLPSHYRKSIGREVVVKAAAGDANATHRGTLTGADDESFTVDAEQGPVSVGYDDVVSAKTVFRWEKTPKPGHSKENS